MKDFYLRAPAKLNLFLKVGKIINKKKYHNIQSLIFTLDLYDEIRIRKIHNKKDIVSFSGIFKRDVKIDNNSITKSIDLLRKSKFINKKNKYKITVKKNIPVFSGLGGGSSNAATIIKFFIRKKISEQKINYFSKHLGTDIKIFFKGNKVYQKNFLSLKKFNFKHNFYLLIIFPFVKSSTSKIYSKFKKHEQISNKDLYQKVSKIDLVKNLRFESNSLQNVVENKFPIVKKIINELNFLKNCEFSRLTGSGSACFGLFLNKSEGITALKRIKKRFPSFWCVLSKTI